MKQLKLIFSFFLMMALASNAQEANFSSDGYQEDVALYLDSNGTLAQYEYAYGELLKMLEKQFPKSESNAKGWEYLLGNEEKAIAEIKSLLVPIYQQNFEQGDIKKMIAFYQSDTGKQLMQDRSQMTEMQKKELNDFYTTEVGQKIIEKQPILTEEISKVSEGWSRELYETAISLLNNG